MNVLSIQQVAKNAIEIQNAVNLIAVVHNFHQAIESIRVHARANGKILSTQELWAHPICVLYSSKIASLTQSDSATVFSKAYEACMDMCGGE